MAMTKVDSFSYEVQIIQPVILSVDVKRCIDAICVLHAFVKLDLNTSNMVYFNDLKLVCDFAVLK